MRPKSPSLRPCSSPSRFQDLSYHFWSSSLLQSSSFLLRGRRIAIRESLQESHDKVLLLAAQPEVTQLLSVRGFGIFRRRPASQLLAPIVRLARRQRIARVVEMH